MPTNESSVPYDHWILRIKQQLAFMRRIRTFRIPKNTQLSTTILSHLTGSIFDSSLTASRDRIWRPKSPPCLTPDPPRTIGAHRPCRGARRHLRICARNPQSPFTVTPNSAQQTTLSLHLRTRGSLCVLCRHSVA